MPSKAFTIPGIGVVKAYKRRGARHVRLSMAADGSLRVSLPAWASYASALRFVQSQEKWIKSHPKPALLNPGYRVGKAHVLTFVPTPSQRVTSRMVGNEVRVSYPDHFSRESAPVQAAARRASLRALALQAQQLLPDRLVSLAVVHGFTYRSVVIKRLSSRWGSCSSRGDIILNAYLMQLPWHLIDYVILHELTHTRVPRHGPAFWRELESSLPEASKLRKEIRQHRAALLQTTINNQQ